MIGILIIFMFGKFIRKFYDFNTPPPILSLPHKIKPRILPRNNMIFFFITTVIRFKFASVNKFLKT